MDSKENVIFNIKKYRKQVIFALDIMIISSVFIGLFFIHPYGTMTDDVGKNGILFNLLTLILCWTAFQLIFKTYDSLWRYAESKEYLTLMAGASAAFVSYLYIDFVVFRSNISFIFMIAVFSISLISMLIMRLLYRLYRKYKIADNSNCKIPLVIVGAGAAGVQLLEEIEGNPNNRYKTYCFFDDSVEKIGKTIHNVKVYGPIKNMPIILKDKIIDEIIVAIPSVDSHELREILKFCSSIKCHVKILPNILTLMQNGSASLSSSVREVKIEELLGREAVIFDNGDVKDLIYDKVVMVTGGAGSIGSELCRQIAEAAPSQLIILDINENSSYDLQQELKYIFKDKLDLKIEIASVRDNKKIDILFEKYRPNLVFHAAAHKHVPLMEDCPEEAIKNNVFGTYNVVLAADKWNVEKFVLISTDKAVNPTNIMGTSKRLCEMIIQSMEDVSATKYVAVRFGNVLGSNGSVVPLFKRQIEHGGPVTITDKRVIRYFMTIPEAAQLVLQAASMAKRSEIYVLDMGEPVKIIDLAENLIRLSGYEPYVDIAIEEVGLRPGEKLYEELLINSEELEDTSNHKIFIDKQKRISSIDMSKKLALLENSIETKLIPDLIKILKTIVPTYKDPEEVNSKVLVSEINEKNTGTVVKTG